MTEFSPVPFDREAAEQALGALSARINDADHGEGNLLMTPGGQTLEVFTDAVRITGSDFKVEVTGQPLTPDVGPDWVGFRGTADGMTRFVALRNSGEVVFKKTAPREVYQAEAEQAHSLPQPAAQQEASSPPPADDKDVGQAAAEPGTERGELVSFTGNLGRAPKVFTVQDKPRVKLIVGEHHQADDGKDTTTWHEVWTTDKLGPKTAKLVEDGTLTQGVEVSIRGYRHERPPQRPGAKPQPFVRAFMVNPVQGQRKQ